MRSDRADGSRTTRRLLIFVAASVLLHFMLTAAVIVGPDWLPGWPKASKPDQPLPSIEFVMVQQKGFGKPTSPDAPAKDAPEAPAQPVKDQAKQEPPPKQETPPAETTSQQTPPPPEDEAAEPGPAPPPPPAPDPPRQTQVTATPVPPPAAKPAPEAEPGPEINLGGTDSLSSLIATGTQMIPVGVDTKLRNREPIYPEEAARRGQRGLVVVQAHVSPDGHADAVDIERSSGYPMLDNAARDAVITWHFHPAIESGVPVQSTISVAIDFTLR